MSSTLTVTVAGAAKNVLSYRGQAVMNGRDTLTIEYVSLTGTGRPSRDEEVISTVGGTRVFGGSVDRVLETMFDDAPPPAIKFSVDCNDFNAIANRRYVYGTFLAGTTLKQVLQRLAEYVAEFGVVLDPTQITGPTLTTDLNYDFKLWKDVIDEVCKLSGNYTWVISSTKVLKAYLPGTVSAPINITDALNYHIGDVTVEQPTRDNYANRILLRFDAGTTTTDTWTVAATGQVTFALTNVYSTSPELVTVNGTPNIPFSSGWSVVNVGVDVTLNGRFAAVYGSFGANWNAIDASTKPDALALFNEALAAWGPTAHIAPGGTANWNAQIVAYCPSGWALVAGSGQTASTTIEFTYSTAYPTVLQADNTTEQAAHGVWEKPLIAPSVQSEAAANALATAYLTSSIVTPRTVTYKTFREGLAPGQTQTINIANRNINATCLITEVRAEMIDEGNILQYTVTAVEGTIFPGTWRDTYEQWNGNGGGTSATSIGSSGGGGGVAGSTKLIYPLAMSETNYVQGATWVRASQINVLPMVTVSTVVNARLAAISGTVTARLYCSEDAVAVGTSAIVSSSSLTAVSFSADLTAGKTYWLELLPSVVNSDVVAVGYLESI